MDCVWKIKIVLFDNDVKALNDVLLNEDTWKLFGSMYLKPEKNQKVWFSHAS